MTKLAFILHARDKAKHVKIAARSMLFQECERPFEVILSDHGSVDGTKEILEEQARLYNGPNKARFVQCPHTNIRGMPGLNAHINWTMTQTDADFILQLSADDYALPKRVEKVWAAFEEHKPSMALTGMYYVDEDMKYLAESAHPDKDGWCILEEMYPKYIGGSASQAWTHEFFDKIGGLSGVGSQDVVMPFLAVLDKGAYYLRERLHCYRKCVGLQNTGLQGVLDAVPEGDPRRMQIEELIHFQVLSGHYAVLMKMDQAGLRTDEAVYHLVQAILDRSASWSNIRQKMTLEGVPPTALRA